jgi:hypothetical protein
MPKSVGLEASGPTGTLDISTSGIAEARKAYAGVGHLIISTRYPGYLKKLALVATEMKNAHFTALWDFVHIKFWLRSTLVLLLREAGFVIGRFVDVGRIRFL